MAPLEPTASRVPLAARRAPLEESHDQLATGRDRSHALEVALRVLASARLVQAETNHDRVAPLEPTASRVPLAARRAPLEESHDQLATGRDRSHALEVALRVLA